MRRYVDWLCEKKVIRFNADWLRVRHQILPQLAENFLTSLEPTLKLATVRLYRGSLRLFHNWLAARDRPLESLSREDVQGWLQNLFDRGQAPATRLNEIVAVRVYLRTLAEQGAISVAADELIRPSDLPKLPQYLLRPLAPDVDQELRTRMGIAKDPHQRGLLVMRNTGLRIGELSSLEFNCIRRDETGKHFLKVPLGKLNNERLVPLDNETLELPTREGPAPRTWLLETIRGRRVRYSQFKIALDAPRRAWRSQTD